MISLASGSAITISVHDAAILKYITNIIKNFIRLAFRVKAGTSLLISFSQFSVLKKSITKICSAHVNSNTVYSVQPKVKTGLSQCCTCNLRSVGPAVLSSGRNNCDYTA